MPRAACRSRCAISIKLGPPGRKAGPKFGAPAFRPGARNIFRAPNGTTPARKVLPSGAAPEPLTLGRLLFLLTCGHGAGRDADPDAEGFARAAPHAPARRGARALGRADDF